MHTLYVFRAGCAPKVEADLSALPALLADPTVMLWLDLVEPIGDEGRLLHEVFRFHPLAVEDTVHDYGHPKLDTYEDHLFMILHAIDFGSLDLVNRCYVGTIELDVFFGERFLVTHHPPGMRSVEGLVSEIQQAGPAKAWTTIRLFHRLLDHMVDNFVPVIEGLGSSLEALEDAVIQHPSPAHLDRILTAKKTIHRLRRVTAHQKSILESLAKGSRALLPPAEQVFYRDVFDHFVYVVDLVDSYREQVQSIMDAYHSVTSNRMNEIVKVLTQISTLMLPLTFIAGVYGMNFDNMPELHWSFGYPFALGLMVATAVGMVAYFRSRRLL